MRKNINTPIPEQQPPDTLLNYNEAWEAAHTTARRAKRLAAHVIHMVDAGTFTDRAKMGRFPNRYPTANVDKDSLTMATNAELRETGKDINVGVEEVLVFDDDARLDGTPAAHELDVVVNSVNGQATPASTDRYSELLSNHTGQLSRYYNENLNISPLGRDKH